MPGLDVRGWRKLIEFRQKLLAKRVASKNQIRSALRANGVAVVRGLWTKKGLTWLATVPLPAAKISEPVRSLRAVRTRTLLPETLSTAAASQARRSGGGLERTLLRP